MAVFAHDLISIDTGKICNNISFFKANNIFTAIEK